MEAPIEIKKLFLSFIQTYFKTEYAGLPWNVDPRKTKIFIGDKNIASPEVVEIMPSIILNRGTMQWAFVAIDQIAEQTVSSKEKLRADLIQSSLTLMCTSTNGIEAESIASRLFTVLVEFKDQLRANGIHQIRGISLGEEQRVRSDSQDRLNMVPVAINFAYQMNVSSGMRDYKLKLYTDTDPVITLQESMDYLVSGQTVTLTYPLTSGISIYADYTGAITLTDYTHVLLIGAFDGVNKIYQIPTEAPYGYYYIWRNFVYDAINTG